MAADGHSSRFQDAEYEALHQALTESERGRWFLEEYLRRNLAPETRIVLDAIERLEKVIVRERTVPDINRIRLSIADMQEAIERTKREIANIKHESEYGNRFTEASSELDAIVTQTEGATQEILAAAEAIQELAWTLREQGADEGACDDIDARATEIFMACSFQDLTGQRTQKIVQALHYLESRINLMVSIWGIDDIEVDTDTDAAELLDTRPDAHLLNGPQLAGKGVDQSAVDAMFNTDGDTAIPDNPPKETDEAAPENEADVFAPSPVAATRTVDFDFDRMAADDGEADVFARPTGKTAARPASDIYTIVDDVMMVDADGPSEDEAAADAAWEAELGREALEDDRNEDPLKRLSPGERQSLFS